MLVPRVEDAAGNALGRLPDCTSVAWSVARSAPGALQLTYPASGRNAALLALDDAYLVVPAPWGDEFFLLDDDADDPADDAGDNRPLDVACRGMMAELARVRVYPAEHVAGQSLVGYRLGGHSFVDQTPGAILGTLVARGKARGALPRLAVGFTNAADSNGTTWPTLYTRAWEAGTGVDDVAQQMVDAGWLDLRMEGTVLRAYVPDGGYADRPGVVVRSGQGILQGPRKRTRSATRSVLFTSGDDGFAVETVDQAALARFGRREGFEGRAGIADADVLDQVSRASLDDRNKVSETFTLAWAAGTGPAAGTFREGDFVRWDARRVDTKTLEPLRVQSVAFGQDDVGPEVCSVELADRWVEDAVARRRRVDAQTLGSTQERGLPRTNPGTDVVGPESPRNVTLTAGVFYNSPRTAVEPREAVASGTVSWTPVDRNEDGTAYDDHLAYFVSVLVPRATGGAAWTAEELVGGTGPVVWQPLPWSAVVQARVRAQDRAGNSSSYGYSAAVPMLAAYSAPGTASAPVLRDSLGQVAVDWDGRDSAGNFPAAPVTGAEVHLGTSSGFTPDDTTRAEFLAGRGTVVLAPLGYAAPTYVKLVLVDYLGQRGTPTAARSITPKQVTANAIQPGVVGTAKLANLAVKTANIADLAVNNAFIVSMDVGKIGALGLPVGSLTSTLLLAGTIRTAAALDSLGNPTGARFQFDSDGMTAYNASGQVTARVATSGAHTFAGVMRAIESTGNFRVRNTALSPGSVLIRSAGGSPVTGGVGFAIPLGIVQEYLPAQVAEWLPPYESSRYGAAQRPFGLQILSPTVRGPKTGVTSGLSSSYSARGYQTIGIWLNNTREFNNAGAQAQATFVLGAPTQEYAKDGTRIMFNDSPGDDTSAPAITFWGGGSGDGVVPGTGTDPTPETPISSVYLLAQSTELRTVSSVRASGFPGTSARSRKTAVTEPTVDPLAVLAANPAMEWQYADDPAGRRRLGPMADGLPGLVAPGGEALDQACATGLVWAALAEIDRRMVLAGV